MARYRIVDPHSGSTMEIDREHQPTEQEIEELFRKQRPPGRGEGPVAEEKKQGAQPGASRGEQQGQEGGARATLAKQAQGTALKREETRETIAEAGVEEKPEQKQDVILDVPQLHIDEIKLDVEDLGAKLALRAELANMLRVSVGAEVNIAKVDLDIKGVETQALLKARLEQVTKILSRALDTIDRNPDLLRSVLQPIGEAGKELGKGVGQTGKELGKGVGGAVGEAGKGLGGAVGEAGKGVGGAVGEAGKGVGGAVGEAGKGVGGAVGEAGKGVGETGKEAAKQVGGAVGQTGKQVGETGKEAGKQAGGAVGEAGKQAGQGGEMTEVAKGVTARKGPVAEAVREPSQGADRSVEGHAETSEEERRHFEKKEKEEEREPVGAKK